MALEHLLAALERDALSRTQELLERAHRDAEALRTEGGARIARERSERLGAVEAELRGRSQARILEARRAALRRTLEARQRAFEAVLREALRRLPEIQRGEAFRASLPGTIAQALRFVGDEPVIVSCPPGIADEVRRCIGNRPGVMLRTDPAAPAGVRVETADGALMVDGSLESRLEQLRPHLLIRMLDDLEDGP